MIKVKRLNNSEILLNCELIEIIEETPDTIITLINGHKIVVIESADEVLNKIISYKRRIYGVHPQNQEKAYGKEV
ncbi:flagellar FlbD family protein [Natronincola ferrireducens]|uniref:Flagellar protein FlbD n=1 Tax=Natronincola ferrireducens TaxID=393762 RepID=A0A1G9C2M8_9FIRM|nr:flagellar FlbD family protein [Natronincola ferrireducens]SDK45535.1 flagellar protein FlbD [Natronincola ferrireducens]